MIKMKKRVFLIVLDSLGIGAAPDAHLFGDAGTNTLKRISTSKSFNIPTLISLGIGNVDGVDYLEKVDTPPTVLARLCEKSAGKDTTVGHWELAGRVSHSPLPTYPDGFPESIIGEFEKRCGIGALCNKPYSGTEVIRDWGEEHIRTGKLIVYTSADSVFQIAAHEKIVPPDRLYEYCRIARELLTGEHGVGRVIARPFVGEPGNFTRTANRRDFSLKPPYPTLLDKIKEAGLDVISVGKIKDIFDGEGITESLISHSNREGMEMTEELLTRDFHGLCFTNLVEFDSHYGHRQDIDGYAAALTEFDSWLAGFIRGLGEEDALIITADHGCDPGDDSTDHTREYVPFIMLSDREGKNLGTVTGFDHVARTVAELLGVDFTPERED